MNIVFIDIAASAKSKNQNYNIFLCPIDVELNCRYNVIWSHWQTSTNTTHSIEFDKREFLRNFDGIDKIDLVHRWHSNRFELIQLTIPPSVFIQAAFILPIYHIWWTILMKRLSMYCSLFFIVHWNIFIIYAIFMDHIVTDRMSCLMFTSQQIPIVESPIIIIIDKIVWRICSLNWNQCWIASIFIEQNFSLCTRIHIYNHCNLNWFSMQWTDVSCINRAGNNICNRFNIEIVLQFISERNPFAY